MVEWKTIEEATNYEVSNYGQVRNKTTQRILKNQIESSSRVCHTRVS